MFRHDCYPICISDERWFAYRQYHKNLIKKGKLMHRVTSKFRFWDERWKSLAPRTGRKHAAIRVCFHIVLLQIES